MIVPRGYGIPSTRIISRGYGGSVATITAEWVEIELYFKQIAHATPFFTHFNAPELIPEHIAMAEWTFGHPGEIEFTANAFGDIGYSNTHAGVLRLLFKRVGSVEIVEE